MIKSDRKTIILVADDDVRVCRFIRMYLGSFGCTVCITLEGTDVIQIAGTIKPDIILLDLIMSPVDGLTVLRELRKTSSIPVIAMSENIETAGKAIESGANDFIGKPFDPGELVNKISGLVDLPRPTDTPR